MMKYFQLTKVLKTQHEERKNKKEGFFFLHEQIFWVFLAGCGEEEQGAGCIDHGASEEEVRASASNSSTDCYEGPCVSIHPTTL